MRISSRRLHLQSVLIGKRNFSGWANESPPQRRDRIINGNLRYSKVKEVNAFCLPGGKVAFWEGIMPIAQDDSGVAVIMGHEVAHALARHGAERVSQSIGAEVVGQILAAGVGIANPGLADQVAQLYGITANVGVILPWGRAQESEADHIGLILMAKAGYDPSTAVGFWERMSKVQQDGKPPEFLSTHPSDETRINQIKQWLPEAQKYYQTR